MKYTVVLTRGERLREVFDHTEMDAVYVANPETDFANVTDAAKAARKEAAAADLADYKQNMRMYGRRGKDYLPPMPEDYSVLLAFKGQHEPIFGWQPELEVLQ